MTTLSSNWNASNAYASSAYNNHSNNSPLTMEEYSSSRHQHDHRRRYSRRNSTGSTLSDASECLSECSTILSSMEMASASNPLELSNSSFNTRDLSWLHNPAAGSSHDKDSSGRRLKDSILHQYCGTRTLSSPNKENNKTSSSSSSSPQKIKLHLTPAQEASLKLSHVDATSSSSVDRRLGMNRWASVGRAMVNPPAIPKSGNYEDATLSADAGDRRKLMSRWASVGHNITTSKNETPGKKNSSTQADESRDSNDDDDDVSVTSEMIAVHFDKPPTSPVRKSRRMSCWTSSPSTSSRKSSQSKSPKSRRASTLVLSHVKEESAASVSNKNSSPQNSDSSNMDMVRTAPEGLPEVPQLSTKKNRKDSKNDKNDASSSSQLELASSSLHSPATTKKSSKKKKKDKEFLEAPASLKKSKSKRDVVTASDSPKKSKSKRDVIASPDSPKKSKSKRDVMTTPDSPKKSKSKRDVMTTPDSPKKSKSKRDVKTTPDSMKKSKSKRDVTASPDSPKESKIDKVSLESCNVLESPRSSKSKDCRFAFSRRASTGNCVDATSSTPSDNEKEDKNPSPSSKPIFMDRRAEFTRWGSTGILLRQESVKFDAPASPDKAPAIPGRHRLFNTCISESFDHMLILLSDDEDLPDGDDDRNDRADKRKSKRKSSTKKKSSKSDNADADADGATDKKEKKKDKKSKKDKKDKSETSSKKSSKKESLTPKSTDSSTTATASTCSSSSSGSEGNDSTDCYSSKDTTSSSDSLFDLLGHQAPDFWSKQQDNSPRTHNRRASTGNVSSHARSVPMLPLESSPRPSKMALPPIPTGAIDFIET